MRYPLERPIPPQWKVRDAVDAYLDENGFSPDDYDAPFGKVAPFGIAMKIPNPPARKKGLRRHDLHHIVTGFGTDMTGESEVSAWELSRGLRGTGGLYVKLLIVSAFLWGFVQSPRRTVRALRIAPGDGSLFSEDDYEALINLTVGELRAKVGLPPEGIAAGPRGLHVKAPKLCTAVPSV